MMRFFRIARLLKLIKINPGIKRLLATVVVSAPSLFNVGMLLLLVMYIFAILGVEFFHGVAHGEFINDDANFSTFGDALLTLDIDSDVKALAVFKEPATSAPRLACGSRDGKVRVFDAVSGGDALLVFDTGYSTVNALVVFKDPATGVLRLATSYGKIFDPLAGGEALVVLKGCGGSLVAFTDPATGAPRLVSGSEKGTVRVWNPAVSGAAIDAEPEGHSDRVKALVTFVDPATGALRVATGSKDIRVWDAETGSAVLVIDVGSSVKALVFFTDPATGAPRLVTSSGKVFDPIAGGAAIAEPGELPKAVRERLNGEVRFADPATGAQRLARASGSEVNIYPAAGGAALVVLEGHTEEVRALTVFEDPTTGGLRLASGSLDNSVRVWDLVAGGTALFVLKGHTGSVEALTAFVDPATGETRLVGGSTDKTLRVWDASTGAAALRVVAFDDNVSALAVRSNMSGLFVASGKGWGELRVA